MAEALSVVLLAETYDRVQYGLSLALAAASLGRPVTLLFAGPALHLLTEDGWQEAEAQATRAELTAHGIATAEELIELTGELGILLLACDARMRLQGVTADDFLPDLAVEVSGLVAVLADGAPVVV